MLAFKSRFVWWSGVVFSTAGVATLWFWWQGAMGFSLWDEGFLWYGVQRISAGDLPIRDFFGYDIGRYLILAQGAEFWGSNGLVAMRFGLALMHWVLLLVVVWLLRHEGVSWWWIFPTVIVVTLWVWPLYRMPDMLIAVGAVAMLSMMQRRMADPAWVFGAALIYGILMISVGDMRKHVAFFGFGMVMIAVAWLLEGKPWRLIVGWFNHGLQGLMIGMLPLLGFALVRPDFRASYWQHMLVGFLQRETPNIPLPYPWLWQMGDAVSGHTWWVSAVFTVFVIAGPLWLVVIMWQSWRGQPSTPVVRAGVVLWVPYISYVLSRADLAHLTQGMLVGVMAVLMLLITQSRAWVRVVGVGVTLAVSGLVMVPVQPAWECRDGQDCREVDILGDSIRMPGPLADEVALIQQFGADYARDGASVYIIPFWPGAYSILDVRSPVWEIYAIWPRDEEFQLSEIARLEVAKPVAVLLKKEGLDGNEALRFRNTHPMMYDYLREQYRPVANYTLLPGYTIMERRK